MLHEPLDDIHLVEHSQLHSDHGKVVRVALGLRHFMLMPVVEQQHPEAVGSVNAQDGEKHEIGAQHDGSDDVHHGINPPQPGSAGLLIVCQGRWENP